MFSSILEYSYGNAKIRTLLSFLLDAKTFNELMDSRDISSACEVLKETPYRAIIERFEKEGWNISFLEKELLKQEIAVLKKVYNSIFSTVDRTIVSLLIQKYEIEEIKIALRLWHKKESSDVAQYFLGEKIWFDIDYKKIVSSPDLSSIIQILNNTPYGKSIAEARKSFEEKNSVFFLEASLDRDNFRKLVSSTKKLLLADRITVSRIIGAEIDIENLNWLVRTKNYYSLEREEIDRWLIEGGNLTDKDFITSFLSGRVESIHNISFADMAGKNEYMLEIALSGILSGEIKKILSGYPFTLGIILCYVILKKREIKNITLIINAKNYGFSKEEISMLIGQME